MTKKEKEMMAELNACLMVAYALYKSSNYMSRCGESEEPLDNNLYKACELSAQLIDWD